MRFVYAKTSDWIPERQLQLPIWVVACPLPDFSHQNGTTRSIFFVRDFSGHLIRSLKIGFLVINAIILCVIWINETSAEKKNTNFTQDLCMRTSQLEFIISWAKMYWCTQRLLAAR